jgi:hypothetical protein
MSAGVPERSIASSAFPAKQAWLSTAVPLIAYLASLLFPWFCFNEPGIKDCVYGFLALLWFAPNGAVEIISSGEVHERFFGAIMLLALVWPPIYWYLAVCWICLERPVARNLFKFIRVLLMISAAAALSAMAVWLLAPSLAEKDVRPEFLIASFLPLISAVILQRGMSKHSW